MPTYRFKCTEGHVSEKAFKMADKPDVTQCGKAGCKHSARRIYDAAPVHFAGSGWGGKP